MDLGFDLEGTVVIVTGAGGQIGQVIVEAFLSAGCFVGGFDINQSKFTNQHKNLLWVLVDTTDEDAMEIAWQNVGDHFQSTPTVCISAAAIDLSFLDHHSSILTMPTKQFRRTLEVNTVGTFITAKMWLRGVDAERTKSVARLDQTGGTVRNGTATTQPNTMKNISFVVIGSEAGILGVPGNPDYAASKSAVQGGLVLSLAPDAANIHPRARVNAICPGAVNTPQFQKECARDDTNTVKWIESEASVTLRKPVELIDIARYCLFLASERWSGSTTGQSVRIDGGKSGRLYWGLDGKAMW